VVRGPWSDALMALTTEGLIEELRRFRADKMALVALVGSMGAESETDALDRLREIKDLASETLETTRRTKKADRTQQQRVQEPIWRGVYDLATEIEPWLARVVEGVKVAA
jgi:hypothetical protein